MEKLTTVCGTTEWCSISRFSSTLSKYLDTSKNYCSQISLHICFFWNELFYDSHNCLYFQLFLLFNRMSVVLPTSRFAYIEVVSPTRPESIRLHLSRFAYTYKSKCVVKMDEHHCLQLPGFWELVPVHSD